MTDKNFKSIISTTHVDSHNERFTVEALQGMVDHMNDSTNLTYVLWNHQSTLPPIGLMSRAYVEERSDGEHQAVADGVWFGSTHEIPIDEAEIELPLLDEDEIKELVKKYQDSAKEEGFIEIAIDRQNIPIENVKEIFEEINDQVPTRIGMRGRKAEIPQEVIWILVGFAGGMITRVGELTVDGALAYSKIAMKSLNEAVSKLFAQSKPTGKPDVIFKVEIPNSDVLVEGAVEYADKDKLEHVWEKLPNLYARAESLIARNRPNYFSILRYIYNPITDKWEVNYFVTREHHKIIVGKRYTDPNHPLRRRWDEQQELLKNTSADDRAASVG